MRIWDINPGYLNRQSLLGEHRELHGLLSILVNGKKGYSRHPETLRWVGHEWALKQRHQLLSAEMSLRGFNDKTPVMTDDAGGSWPEIYIDEPFRQFHILKTKYLEKEPGRIPLPSNAQQLWAQHKYSILARDVNLYKTLGRQTSRMKPHDDYSYLAMLLSESLRTPPPLGGLRNALQHMWGYVSERDDVPKGEVESWPLSKLLEETQQRSLAFNETYLMSSTALGELKAWLPDA